MFRTTSNTYISGFNNQLQVLQSRISKYQNDISTGKKIHNASDDPSGYSQVLGLQSDQRAVQQLRRNANAAETRINSTYSAAADLQTVVSRASELAIQANGTLSDSDREVIATEIDNLLEQALTIGNRREDSTFLFGGTSLLSSDTDPVTGSAYVPFSATRDATTGEITAVAYRGNYTTQKIEVSTSTVMDASVLGARNAAGQGRALFVDNQLSTPVDVFQTLIDMRDNLRNNTYDSTTTVAELNNVEDNVAVVIGMTSANLSRLETVTTAHTRKLTSDETTLSQIADSDLASAALSLTQAQTTYEAALSVGGQILNVSLLNYL
ncbi:MAG: hypothetical protein PHV34_12215 [Verrucomicrobiae bacterium]|nr:hypothetical protein [Verrucomicrobiae bacterium]